MKIFSCNIFNFIVEKMLFLKILYLKLNKEKLDLSKFLDVAFILNPVFMMEFI